MCNTLYTSVKIKIGIAQKFPILWKIAMFTLKYSPLQNEN